MPNLPRISGRALVRVLERSGWRVDRVTGRHHLLKAPDGRRVTVPVHGNKTLPIGTLDTIVEGLGLSNEEFAAMLRGKRR